MESGVAPTMLPGSAESLPRSTPHTGLARRQGQSSRGTGGRGRHRRHRCHPEQRRSVARVVSGRRRAAAQGQAQRRRCSSVDSRLRRSRRPSGSSRFGRSSQPDTAHRPRRRRPTVTPQRSRHSLSSGEPRRRARHTSTPKADVYTQDNGCSATRRFHYKRKGRRRQASLLSQGGGS